MSAAPVITIFVRHNPDCKHNGDEFSKRCQCRKHFRWSHDGKQHRLKAGTRSWAEAEELKRSLEDKLAGRTPVPIQKAKSLQAAAEVFIQDKKVQGVTDDVIQKYTRLLARLREYCESTNVHNVDGLSREQITGFCSTWETLYPSSTTRAKVRERLRSFLRYCYEAQWLDRIPPVPKFKIEEPETQPLTPEEYKRLLQAIPKAIQSGDPRRKTDKNSGRRAFDDEEKQCLIVRAFIQEMRWTGLAIRDALTLRRDALTYDETSGLYTVNAKRVKTGTPVSVPIPQEVAEEMLAAHALNSNEEYFFWSGNGEAQSATSNWGQRYIAPVFRAAGIVSEGNMLSHRLRDTFAVDLLEKGVPMEEVSKALGHTSIRTTEKHYAKWSRGRQNRLEQLISATW